jgi:microcystin-dependent protein
MRKILTYVYDGNQARYKFMSFHRIIILLLLLLIPANFAFAQTDTPTPSPTPSLTPTPTPTELRGLVPIGSIVLYGSDTPPDDAWLVCDGHAEYRSEYAELFAVIGTHYGVGDGSTTFNVPDLRGRVPVGDGAGLSPLSTRVLGQTFGEEQHTLTITEIPAHTHTLNASGFQIYELRSNGSGGNGLAAGSFPILSGQVNTGSTGGGAAHNIMQPSLVVAYYIYAGEPFPYLGGGSGGGGGESVDTPTPDGLMVYSTVQYGDQTQNVAVRYEITAGDVMVSILLFIVACLLILQIVIRMRRA